CMPLHPPGQAANLPVGIPDLDEPARHTSTRVPPDVWNQPDFRLWHALHQPGIRVADHRDPHGRRTGVTVYTATGRATADYTTDPAGPWPVIHDLTRLWDGVETAWAGW